MSTIKVKRARIILSDPTMGYAPVATMLAERGLGVGWVRANLGIEPEVIDLGVM